MTQNILQNNTTIKVRKSTRERINKLAHETGMSIDALLNNLIQKVERERFFAELQKNFEEIDADYMNEFETLRYATEPYH